MQESSGGKHHQPRSRLVPLLRRMAKAGTQMTSGVQLDDSMNRRAEDLSEPQVDRATRDAILEAMVEGVVLVDEIGVVQYLNPAAKKILGGRQLNGKPLATHALKRLTYRLAESGALAEEQFDIGPPPRTIRASALLAGEYNRTLLVLRDVTETVRTDAIRRDFAAAASHELKTPVASIKAAAETLGAVMDDDPVASRRFAAQILKDADRLARIVGDLLDLARMESSGTSVEQVDLARMLREEAKKVEDDVVKAGLVLDVRADGPMFVTGSSKDLSLALRNLIENAVQYTHAGGMIIASAATSGGDVAVSIKDTGIGIPSKDLPRIFERFYRVDRARARETGGAGLGLALVKHVAEQHGGRVETESELGRGSTFRLIIPTP